jgi:hypothetical protein
VKQYSDPYVIKDDNKHNSQYTKGNFKEINNMEQEIIGYLVPCDIFNGEVKKGSLYTKNTLEDCKYYWDNKTNMYQIPKEIVETWQPVYKTKETILQIGNPSKKVFISKDKIEVEGKNVDISDLKLLVQKFPRGSTLSDWIVEFNSSAKIGCSVFEKNELQSVIDTYNYLNS